MTIESAEHTLERRRLMKQLEARVRRPCKKLSLRLCELDWRAPICPSRRCSEMDDNQSLTMATYTKLCGILPYLIYLISMSAYETSNWMWRRRYTYRRPCRTEYNPDYYSRDQMKSCTAEITLLIAVPNTMTIRIRNTMPYLFRSYITENTPEYDPGSDSAIPSYKTTMSIDDCKSTSELSPCNRCSLRSLMRLFTGGATTFKRGRWLYQNLKQPLPQTITVPEVQEQSTIRYIHQLRRLAAASAPGHESASGLRERR